MMADDVKLPFFQGNGTEDPEQYWFLCEAVQTIKQVQGNDIKKGQLTTTFRGWVLDWYMKFVQVPTGHPQKILAQIRTRLIEEFKKPKYESQYITKLKEIKQYPNESIWDFDQRFKTLMAKVSFVMSDL